MTDHSAAPPAGPGSEQYGDVGARAKRKASVWDAVLSLLRAREEGRERAKVFRAFVGIVITAYLRRGLSFVPPKWVRSTSCSGVRGWVLRRAGDHVPMFLGPLTCFCHSQPSMYGVGPAATVLWTTHRCARRSPCSSSNGSSRITKPSSSPAMTENGAVAAAGSRTRSSAFC